MSTTRSPDGKPPKLSIVVPAHDEEKLIVSTLEGILTLLRKEGIPFEVIVVNDACRDNTKALVEAMQRGAPEVRLVNRRPPPGFGRAMRSGLAHCTGDVIIPVMADRSEDPRDVIRYYRKIQEGYDCVFGSRFIRGAVVIGYPVHKRIINRLVNRLLQVLFLTRHNDLTNAFKAYRSHVIRSMMPLEACHFNITIEMSLSALVRKYRIASMPIHWNGRTRGGSKLRLGTMALRYLATLIKVWFKGFLIRNGIPRPPVTDHQARRLNRLR